MFTDNSIREESIHCWCWSFMEFCTENRSILVSQKENSSLVLYSPIHLNSAALTASIMCMITRYWSFRCFSFFLNRRLCSRAAVIPPTRLAATCQQHCYMLSLLQGDRQWLQTWSVNNRSMMRPHTWEVCGIGRGNHSVHLEWALCFHLGQWCRRGHFQPQPDSLSTRWKRLTSWKYKTALRSIHLKVLMWRTRWFDSMIPKHFSKLCEIGFFIFCTRRKRFFQRIQYLRAWTKNTRWNTLPNYKVR